MGGVPPDEVIPGRQKRGMVGGGIEVQNERAERELTRLKRKADKLATEIFWITLEANRTLRMMEPGGTTTEEQLRAIEAHEAKRRGLTNRPT